MRVLEKPKYNSFYVERDPLFFLSKSRCPRHNGSPCALGLKTNVKLESIMEHVLNSKTQIQKISWKIAARLV
jgi:hypothetical protein